MAAAGPPMCAMWTPGMRTGPGDVHGGVLGGAAPWRPVARIARFLTVASGWTANYCTIYHTGATLASYAGKFQQIRGDDAVIDVVAGGLYGPVTQPPLAPNEHARSP